MHARRILIVTLFAGLAASTAAAQTRAQPLTIDALIDIRHPSAATWSPDGRAVAFLWDRGGVQNVWLIENGSAPLALTSVQATISSTASSGALTAGRCCSSGRGS